MDTQELLDSIKQNVILGHMDEDDEGFDGDMEGQPGVMELIAQGIEEEVPGKKLLTALTTGMEEVGKRFESGEYMIPDMLASAECVGAAMEELEPHLKAGDRENKGTVVLATVEGDLHDIGKNIVATMLKGAGYNVKDIGINITADKIVQAVKDENARYLGLSALLTTTMVKMEEVVELLKSEGIRDQVKVLIGGAPTSPEFAKKIGADAHGRDAFDAIEKLKQLEASAA